MVLRVGWSHLKCKMGINSTNKLEQQNKHRSCSATRTLLYQGHSLLQLPSNRTTSIQTIFTILVVRRSRSSRIVVTYMAAELSTKWIWILRSRQRIRSWNRRMSLMQSAKVMLFRLESSTQILWSAALLEVTSVAALSTTQLSLLTSKSFARLPRLAHLELMLSTKK